MADALPKPTGFPFLETTEPGERGLLRAALTLILGAAAGMAAAFVAGALVTLVSAGLVSAGGDVGYMAAIDLLANGARPTRSLLSYTYDLAMVGSASIAAAAAFIAVA